MEDIRQPNTKAVFIETPTNPLMMITDIEAVSSWAKSHNLLTIVDNTLLTPFFQRPIELGADIVVHSATKYLGGHNDVLAGLIITKGEELSAEMAFLHNSIGAVLSPSDSYQLMKGMKTLALRMERHEYNSLTIAKYLLEHPSVGKYITLVCQITRDTKCRRNNLEETQASSLSKLKMPV